ncbi:DUF2905 domain-containing protein [Solidesulfovibrio sp.]|jgi:hypothetical protein|uniref:DUF2905 domain-containing protein n=1 Tax=Solidesulfovibrio sp. TaxID=2910990 RepID=UPI000EEB0DDA|nr:DUF2905 domain-containing protein [Solidesulfovibrio sp.]MEA5090201.1 DUF2905 domain-containing protein [Solidesulfovibrio sp.]HCR13505.1 DUF2905 domain-containing protein [Desulfovibrio sp.]HML59835.1 DUF2905 domain-containing protein [Solidesulfovibrio sp.]
MNFSPGKLLLFLGLALACVGALMLLADRPGLWRDLWQRLPLGRLPGDVRIEREGFSVYVPWVTCLVISIGLSLLASWFRK